MLTFNNRKYADTNSLTWTASTQRLYIADSNKCTMCFSTPMLPPAFPFHQVTPSRSAVPTSAIVQPGIMRADNSLKLRNSISQPKHIIADHVHDPLGKYHSGGFTTMVNRRTRSHSPAKSADIATQLDLSMISKGIYFVN